MHAGAHSWRSARGRRSGELFNPRVRPALLDPAAFRYYRQMNSTVFIALLRAVNVGGGGAAMAERPDLLGKLELNNPRTLLQSGNAVFAVATKMTPPALEKKMEA